MNKNITISIVTYFSDHLIFKRLNEFKKYKSIIIENSLQKELKKKIEKKFKSTKVIIPKQNLGYGSGNNLSIYNIKTKYCLIINPDAYLSKKNLNNLFKYIKSIPEFGIAFARFNNSAAKNYFTNFKENYAEVFYDNFLKFSSGCCMLINRELLIKKRVYFFDKNFFLYNEEQDLVKRCQDKKIKIYLLKNCIVKHKPNSSHNPKLNNDVEIFKHWHYTWSYFYFLKKHFGFFFAFKKNIVELIKSLIMSVWNFLIFKKHKRKKYASRLSGLINSILGKKSSLRI